MKRLSASLLALIIGTASAAWADPLVAPGGKPGVAAKWASKDGSVVFTIKDGFAASEVADAITRGVAGAETSVVKGKVVVRGVALDVLLPALERVEVSPQADDIDSMLTAMQGVGDEDEGSGSSIRATKATEMADTQHPPDPAQEMPIADLPTTKAKVIKVRHKRYPVFALMVEIQEAAGPFKAGQQVKVLPLVRTEGGHVKRDDKQSKVNLRAWYSRPGDELIMKLRPKATKHGYHVAETIERTR
jgi:hypothetical protein